ncbi:MAG: hypothetical protein DRJ96_06045 [Thermoprotei archaeon]|nr:MAG: hypothetical protein DRJ96_06045 [Thermoprotei archaeon]
MKILREVLSVLCNPPPRPACRPLIRGQALYSACDTNLPGMRRYELLALLIELAKQGCARSPVKVDRAIIASNLEISAWTLSKWLREAVRRGYLEVTSRGRGRRYFLTPRAIEELKSLLKTLSSSLSSMERIVLRGVVFRGLGEGAYYVSLTEYREWFRRILGFEPYPGTLNVRLDPESIVKRKVLESYEGHRIPPVRRGGESYCSAKVFRAVVNGKVEAGVVIPERTVYGPDVIEVVAKVCLREALGLEDGDTVEIEVLPHTGEPED